MYGSHNAQSNEAQALRARQVDALLKKYPAARIISPDKSVIDIPVMLPTGIQLTFRITLPPSFPNQAPMITLLATANPHMYLDLHSNVTHPKLSRWAPYTNLADLFSDITAEFFKSPPSIINYNMPAHLQQKQHQSPMPMGGGVSPQPGGFYPTPAYSMQGQSVSKPGYPSQPSQPQPYSRVQSQPQPQPQPQQRQQAQSSNSLPTIPTYFPELANKSLAELTQYEQDPAKFDELFQNLEWLKNVNRLIDDVKKGNASMAETNLSQEQELSALEPELNDLRNRFNQQRAEFDQKYQKQQEILQQFAPRYLLDRLSKATTQAEIDSDDFTNSFLNEDTTMTTNEFIKQYMEMRSLYYLRRAKKERFARSQGIF